MSFTLRQLQYFVAVAERGSVIGAARALSVSQSAITESLKNLEADLAVTLFDRHARGLDITQSGHQFLRHATRILTEVQGARRAFETTQGTTGRLNIGVTSLMAGYVMSDLLARYRRMNPAVQVSAQEDSGEYLEHLLIGGELDVAVMVISNLRDRMALQSEILDVSAFRLWLPLEHPLLDREGIGLDDVAQEPLIMLSVDEMEDEAVKLLSAFGRRPQIAFRTRSVEAVRSLVATGAGVALLPDLVYRPWSLDGDRIEARDVSGSLPIVQVGMVWRRGLPLTPPVQDFISLARLGQGAHLRS
ncbi:LysR family transcriptional regulator [Citreicella sp. C3M06]|uniref:LysR family transcriptional regulator n=1 Tax=Roseobacteraceae TaxID=2854170 RepID=UPI001C08C9C6|nr:MULTISPECIES: LysR family transcriptional regulator [Roseobacteraceae]MBU2960099.1 LysR family transcriptional regulator [Citreicella sp. C3M06]MDO6585828.1 LysR family transcriptional regulator [Salipiger sp. 1_MG-2023]